jgi:hypothetical protein
MKAIWSLGLLFSTWAYSLSDEDLVQHVKESIIKANNLESSLNNTPWILNEYGWSSPKVRHLLNNLASYDGCVYFEPGTWAGATFVAALYDNPTTKGYGFEEPVEYGGQSFQKTVEEFNARMLRGQVTNYEWILENVYDWDQSSCLDKMTLYFSDGAFPAEGVPGSIEHFVNVFADTMVVVYDDLNWFKQDIPLAIDRAGYDIIYSEELNSPGNLDISGWWNGIYVGVIKKRTPPVEPSLDETL